MKFIKVKQVTWKHFFLGNQQAVFSLASDDVKIKNYLHRHFDGGNFDKQSIEIRCVKVKRKTSTVLETD